MSLDDEARLIQLQLINRALRKTNRELHQRVAQLGRQYRGWHFVYYNRLVNQKLIGGLRYAAARLRGLLPDGG